MRKRAVDPCREEKSPRREGERVFVYGTLKRGSPYHALYLAGRGRYLGPARVSGELWDTGWGYPALVPGAGWVSGELYGDLGAGDLARLDEWEDHHGPHCANNLYERVRRTVWWTDAEGRARPVCAWVYEAAPRLRAHLIRHGRRVESGVWPAAGKEEGTESDGAVRR
ncbi:gamma-glutamylcyclotransferase family protein [Hydrogenibacillus schlegelii]|uniref:gamma-glutamylcyclotransferase family protein n=1 Tax=Hydrogenibacillus schlegelii TaxID=1484 RepID=UPI002356FFF9|nr:gamma-glutamylcyclotransferase family protein [Hydrogenibacillus schlegelii]